MEGSIFKDFDEATYLKLNPDVSEAVKDHAFASGLEHCLIFGLFEGRSGIPPSMRERLLSDNPVLMPPEHLRKRVHGEESQTQFDKAGWLISYDIYKAISATGGFDENGRILDFGCGCGRVIRFLSRYFEDCRFHGTDIDAEAISWCQGELSNIGEFSINETDPPTAFEDSFFDMVYSISVFTHLPEEMQLAWLEELKRITKPNGLLLLTIHGEELFDNASENHKSRLNENGFLYTVGCGTDGLPDFYQTTYHTDSYILNKWSEYFEIHKILKRSVMNHQDLVICRNMQT